MGDPRVRPTPRCQYYRDGVQCRFSALHQGKHEFDDAYDARYLRLLIEERDAALLRAENAESELRARRAADLSDEERKFLGYAKIMLRGAQRIHERGIRVVR